MRVLFFGVGAFFQALVIQAIIVRFLRPRNHAAVIVAVFGFVSVLAVLLFASYPDSDVNDVSIFADIARLALLLGSLSLAYIAVYSAIEDDSPSMAMVKMAWQARPAGCSEGDLARIMDDRLFLDQRLEAMRRDGWITGGAEVVTLTSLGRFWAGLFRRAQLMLRMDEGG